jgi:peptide/nickel transport system ATP-binding protein
MDAYPHQLSGGMRQRVMIALATFFEPALIIADEPTTALDVVVQKEILMLLMDVQERMGNTILVVSHDMGVHYQTTDKMLIMYAGRVVEYGDTESVFAEPQHAYTKMLIDSLPTIGDDSMRGVLASLAGAGGDRAFRVEPDLIEMKPNHFVARPSHAEAAA